MTDTIAVLVVDDEPSICKLVREILEREGYRVHIAGHGLEALQIIASLETVSCVVTDLVMPNMDGITFGMKLHETYPNLATVVISGRVDLEAASIQALAPLLNSETGCLVKKPFTPARLIEAVRKALSKACP